MSVFASKAGSDEAALFAKDWVSKYMNDKIQLKDQIDGHTVVQCDETTRQQEALN